MKCPHCYVEIHSGFACEWLNNGQSIGDDRNQWQVHHMMCPACKKAILKLCRISRREVVTETFVFPKSSSRPMAPSQVPTELAEDFNEACFVLEDSPKASSALSRRCLQQLLELQGYAHKDLGKAITAAIASKTLTGSLARNLDAIRNIGNFAAHPTKDSNFGSIVEVEPHEAEWNLDVLDGLFDFYYVQPSLDQARADALNIKLAAAGKAPMRQ